MHKFVIVAISINKIISFYAIKIDDWTDVNLKPYREINKKINGVNVRYPSATPHIQFMTDFGTVVDEMWVSQQKDNIVLMMSSLDDFWFDYNYLIDVKQNWTVENYGRDEKSQIAAFKNMRAVELIRHYEIDNLQRQITNEFHKIKAGKTDQFEYHKLSKWLMDGYDIDDLWAHKTDPLLWSSFVKEHGTPSRAYRIKELKKYFETKET